MSRQHRYLVTIGTGRVIHDAVELSADSEMTARLQVQRRIDAGEFYRTSVDVAMAGDPPLVVTFSPDSQPGIVMVFDNGVVQ